MNDDNGILKAITRMYKVSLEDEFCLSCNKQKCNGECADFKKYVANIRKRKLHKKQQNKGL